MPTKERGLPDVPLTFGPDSFKAISEASFSDLCSLQNENLFPPERVMFSHSKSVYVQLMPSFLLASRIILDHPQSFNVFIARRPHEGTVEEDDVIGLEPDELIDIIRCHIPDIDFDPDMSQRGEEYGMTHLRPNETRDLMTIDYTLINLVIDTETGSKRTIIALAYIAILLCHELAHVLEFRSIRNGQFRDDGEAFETPPGITGTEAGTSWETRAFGGSISPVLNGFDLAFITGLSIQSFRWRYLYMAMDFGWIRELFDENFWAERVPSRLLVPYNPELALTSEFLRDEDEKESPEPRTPTKHRRGRDVRVELNMSPKKPANLYSKTQMGRYFRRTCGGKKLHLPPSWPLKGISGTRSDLGDAISSGTTAENQTEEMIHTVRGVKQEKTTPSRAPDEGQSDSNMNSLPSSSSPETASKVVLVKTDESHSTPAEIRPQESAEHGTEEMTHSVRGTKQENTTPSRAPHEGQSIFKPRNCSRGCACRERRIRLGLC